MDSIYFNDPLGLLIELASYRFEPPWGVSHGQVMLEAHKIRVARGDHHIDRIHLADAIEKLTAKTFDSLSADRDPKDPYPTALANSWLEMRQSCCSKESRRRSVSNSVTASFIEQVFRFLPPIWINHSYRLFNTEILASLFAASC
jgi:hypothetical protein